MSVDPVHLAGLHQRSIADRRKMIQADAACIGQLLIGRDVQRRGLAGIFRVIETRMNLSGTVEIRGKLNNKGYTKRIGTVAEIELAP